MARDIAKAKDALSPAVIGGSVRCGFLLTLVVHRTHTNLFDKSPEPPPCSQERAKKLNPRAKRRATKESKKAATADFEGQAHERKILRSSRANALLQS